MTLSGVVLVWNCWAQTHSGLPTDAFRIGGSFNLAEQRTTAASTTSPTASPRIIEDTENRLVTSTFRREILLDSTRTGVLFSRVRRFFQSVRIAAAR